MVLKFGVLSGLSLAIVGSLVAFSPADEPKPAQGPPAAARPKDAPQGPPGSGFPDLVAGLKQTPGCLGVETARTSGGKNLIFAWFKDKAAAVAWYKSPMHRGVMKMMGPDYTPTSTPLKNVKDDGRPLMVIASITFADKPKLEGIPIPISQIAIEAYQPVDGGLAIGGRFAPEAMEVPAPKEETPKK